MTFKIKANDRKPSASATLTYDDGTPVDLTGLTVSFIMRAQNTSGAPKVNAAAVVVGAAAGTVRYDWAVGDTDTPGEYDAEWETVDAAGLTQTFPTDSYNLVTIYADLDGAA